MASAEGASGYGMRPPPELGPPRVEIEHIGRGRYSITLRHDLIMWGPWYRFGEKRAMKFARKKLRERFDEIHREPEILTIWPEDL